MADRQSLFSHRRQQASDRKGAGGREVALLKPPTWPEGTHRTLDAEALSRSTWAWASRNRVFLAGLLALGTLAWLLRSPRRRRL